MKKRWWLLLLLTVLACGDVIGADRLRLKASAPITGDGSFQNDLAGNGSNKVSDGTGASNRNSGAAPEAVAAVIQEEIVLFPIPDSTIHPEYEAVFEDSWMSQRTYGGERGHEGTDIMLSPDARGLFPVLSMTDGIVEKKGWLPQGGYRLGIRSAGGMYYYYAHLCDYAEEIETGAAVVEGQLLGFAGDSGYSNIEGTVGNFPVHLHIGIYYNNEQGEETAVDPYPFLVSLERRKAVF